MMSSMMERTLQHAVGLMQGKTEVEPSVNLHSLVHLLETQTMTKSSEKIILQKFLQTIQHKLSSSKTSISEKRMCIITLLHCNNLTEKTTLFHPLVIQFIEQAKTVADKKLGYIAISLLLDSDGSCLYLIVNTILKDINCSNVEIIATALSSLCNIIVTDLIPVFLPSVMKRLNHPHSRVKCKALIALQKMFQIGPEFLADIVSSIKLGLSDKDPNVMSSALPLLHSFLQINNKNLDFNGENLVFVLSQVEDGHIPLSMMYKGLSAPWVQMRLLTILCKLQESISEKARNDLLIVLEKILNRNQSATGLVQNALVLESLNTVICYHPHFNKLLQVGFHYIENLLISDTSNLVHTGMDLLNKMTRIKPEFASKFQGTIMKTLSSKDDSIRKLSLEMMKTLTNKDNVKVIMNHLLDQMASTGSKSFKSYLLQLVLKLSVKYPTKEYWMLEHFHAVMKSKDFEEKDNEDVLQEAMKFMNTANEEIEKQELHWCVKELDNTASMVHFRYILWVIAEYSYLLEETILFNVIKKIMAPSILASFSTYQKEVGWLNVLSALQTLLLNPSLGKDFSDELNKLSKCLPDSIIVVQTFIELKNLTANPDIAKSMSYDNNKTFEFDENLSFLDEYVEAATLQHPEDIVCDDDNVTFGSSSETTGIIFKSYQAMTNTTRQQQSSFIPTGNQPKTEKVSSFLSSVTESLVQNVWGMDGYNPVNIKNTEDKTSQNSENLLDVDEDDTNASTDSNQLLSQALFSNQQQEKSLFESFSLQQSNERKTNDHTAINNSPLSSISNLNQALENLTNFKISPVMQESSLSDFTEDNTRPNN